MKVPFSPHPLQNFFVCVLFHDRHSDRCEWFIIVLLICISLLISSAVHIFMLIIYNSSLEKMSIHVFSSFLKLGCLIFFDVEQLFINPLWVISFANIFSLSVNVFFPQFPFSVQKFLHLIRSLLFIFAVFPLL